MSLRDTLNYAELNPGIREVVRWLRQDLAFTTTDSGDGVTNVAAGMEGALPVPHVHCRLDFDTDDPDGREDSVFLDARDLMCALRNAGIAVDPSMIQLTYDPVTHVVLLSLYGVDDARLAAARLKAEPRCKP